MNNLLYEFKHLLGEEVTIQAESESLALDTGVKTRTTVPYAIRKALVSDLRAVRASPRLVAYHNQAKEHTTEAKFDTYDIQVVIDRADWPAIDPDINLFILWGVERFQVMQRPESQSAITLYGRAVVGETRRKAIHEVVMSDVVLTSGVTYELVRP